jgi:ATP-dependent helicase HrpB
MDREAPERIRLPSGSERPVDYSGHEPALEARVQELFGLAEHPTLSGRPLVLRLLTPAGRPLQITQDLPGFWRGSWADARKELKGRYPKHRWPEDPAAAKPSKSETKRKV